MRRSLTCVAASPPSTPAAPEKPSNSHRRTRSAPHASHPPTPPPHRLPPVPVLPYPNTFAPPFPAPGYLGGQLNRDGLAFWTVSLWEDEAAMRAYRQDGAHKDAMRRANVWCDELATAHWLQETLELPAWDDIARRVAEGRFLKLQHASPRHLAREVPPPRSRGSIVFAPKSS